MTGQNQSRLDENPFVSSRIRPGAVPFFFPDGDSSNAVLDRLPENNWRGAILGDHGAGKSALMATLLPAAHRAGHATLLIELHDGQRRLPRGWKQQLAPAARQDPIRLLFVDGYEQLGRWQRFLLSRFCRRHAIGLLVTAHHCVGLPVLFRVQPTLDTAQRVVEYLQQGYPFPVSSRDTAEAFDRHADDVREMLFDLFDRYEHQRRTSRSP